jgi:hypothetical protein
MKHQLFFGFFLLLSSHLLGQSSIRGVIRDSRGEALAGANIYIEGTYDGTTSNKEGRFILETPESGDQVLCIEFIGFRKVRKAIHLDGILLDIADVEMKEEINELNAVTITAGTFEAGDKKKSISLSSLDMVTTDGSSGDVYGALQALPGTTTVGESGKLFVKGGDSRESRTYIDGTLVYVPYSSSAPNMAVRGRFSPFIFSGMMFSTGGYSAEYGQALSSVLALKTNAMPVQDQLNISLLSVGAELGGTLSWDQASLTATATYYNLSPYMKLVPQYTRWAKEPESIDGAISFRLRTGKSGMLKIYGTMNRSSLTSIEEDLDHPGNTFHYNLVNDNQYMNVSWNGEIRKDWILSTGFSYTGNLDRMTADSLEQDESLRGTHSKVTLKHKFSDHAGLLAGAEWFARSVAVEFPRAEPAAMQSYTMHTLAGFVEAELYATSRFITRAGTRFEYATYLNRSSLSPRISAAYKLGSKSQVSVAYGWFFQDPDDEFLLRTDLLEFERANHYTFNFLVQDEGRALHSEIYYKQYKNLVKFEASDAGGYQDITNEGHGFSYGLDLFWRDRKTIRNGEYWISYSFIESRRDYRDYPYESVHNYTSRHNLTLVYKHWFDRLRSQLGTNFSIASPRYYNDPNSDTFNGERSLPYRSLNINWSYLLKQNIIIYATVSNLLGSEQQFGYQYASTPDENGVYRGIPIRPEAKRWFLIGCFITLSKNGNLNQLDKIN